MVALGVALDSAVDVGREALVADELEVGEHAREHEEQDMRQHWVSRSDFEDTEWIGQEPTTERDLTR